MMLERRVYRAPERVWLLSAISVPPFAGIFFERSDACVVPNAVDTERFTPQIRANRRETERATLHLSSDIFACS